MEDRFLRLMVLFDLPVNTKKRLQDYVQFRKALIQDSFLMLQYSVYVRLVRNHDDTQKHLRIVEDHLPLVGSVRAMLITKKQYTQMKLLCGERIDPKFCVKSVGCGNRARFNQNPTFNVGF